MDETTKRTLTQFLSCRDAREFIYFNRGKLIVESAGDGTATVFVPPSPLREEQGGTWDCSTPEELFDALCDGMSMLCDTDNVDDTVDAFVDLLSRQRRD